MNKTLFTFAVAAAFAAGSAFAATVHEETFENYQIGTTIADQGNWTAGDGDLSEVIARGAGKALELKTEGATLTNELDDASIANDALAAGSNVVFEAEIKFVPSDDSKCDVKGGDDTKFALFAYAPDGGPTNLVVFHAIDANEVDASFTNEVIEVNGALDDPDAFTKVTVNVFDKEGDLFFTVALNDGDLLTHGPTAFTDDVDGPGYTNAWFKTVNGTSQSQDSEFSAICFRGTGAVDNINVTTVGEAAAADEFVEDDEVDGETISADTAGWLNELIDGTTYAGKDDLIDAIEAGTREINGADATLDDCRLLGISPVNGTATFTVSGIEVGNAVKVTVSIDRSNPTDEVINGVLKVKGSATIAGLTTPTVNQTVTLTAADFSDGDVTKEITVDTTQANELFFRATIEAAE